MNWKAEYQKWMDYKDLNPDLKKELQSYNDEQKKLAFETKMVFGTAGMRGRIGAGTGRMNIYTVKAATIAFCKFLVGKYSREELQRGIVIAHDNRHYSDDFSQTAAEVITSFGIPAYLWKNNELRPTPVLSYSVIKMNTIAGICVTASHNPKIYNGYKIYCEDGYQFLPDATDVIGKYFDNITDFFVPVKPNKSLIKTVPDSIDESYIKEVESLQFYPNQKHDGIKIVYSNLFGTGRNFIGKLFKKTQYDFYWTKKQYEYDPEFTGVPNPNPEYPQAFEDAIEVGKPINSDILILNDPDADRIGIGVLHNGEYVLLSGNQTAPILLEYLLSHYTKNGTMPTKPAMYNTFVTGTLADKVAENYKATVIKTLTGFKWIGSASLFEHQKHGYNFVFGFEEAYGYVIKDVARDKDGIQSAMVLAEACWYYKTKYNKTLVDVLHDIENKYGAYYFHTVAEVFPETIAATKIHKILTSLRNTKIESLAGYDIVKYEDYIDGLYNMPGQDLQKFYFDDNGSWFAVRGSGTEPKIKFYFVCVGKTTADAKVKMEAMWNDLKTNYVDKVD